MLVPELFDDVLPLELPPDCCWLFPGFGVALLLRVDVFLAGCLPELTRSAVQRLLAEGGVTCGGAPVRKNARTEAGAVYAVTLPEARPVETAAQDIPLDIVYEDGDVLVINKPKGLVVHPAAGHEDGTLVNALLYHCGDSLSGVGGERRPGIVHRIDRDTTGLLIVAKNDFAHRRLAAQLIDYSQLKYCLSIIYADKY